MDEISVIVFGKPTAFEALEFDGSGSPKFFNYPEPLLKPFNKSKVREVIFHRFSSNTHSYFELYTQAIAHSSARPGIVFGVAIKSEKPLVFSPNNLKVLSKIYAYFEDKILSNANQFRGSGLVQIIKDVERNTNIKVNIVTAKVAEDLNWLDKPLIKGEKSVLIDDNYKDTEDFPDETFETYLVNNLGIINYFDNKKFLNKPNVDVFHKHEGVFIKGMPELVEDTNQEVESEKVKDEKKNTHEVEIGNRAKSNEEELLKKITKYKWATYGLAILFILATGLSAYLEFGNRDQVIDLKNSEYTQSLVEELNSNEAQSDLIIQLVANLKEYKITRLNRNFMAIQRDENLLGINISDILQKPGDGNETADSIDKSDKNCIVVKKGEFFSNAVLRLGRANNIELNWKEFGKNLKLSESEMNGNFEGKELCLPK